MKAKNLLWPIALMASTVIVIVSLFLAFYVAKNPMATMTLGLFDDVAGAKSAILHTFAMIAVILGLVALVALTVITILKLLNVKVPAAKMITFIGAIVAAVAGVCVLLFALLFGNANTNDFVTCSGGLGLYFAFAGLVIGAVSAFLTRKDLE